MRKDWWQPTTYWPWAFHLRTFLCKSLSILVKNCIMLEFRVTSTKWSCWAQYKNGTSSLFMPKMKRFTVLWLRNPAKESSKFSERLSVCNANLILTQLSMKNGTFLNFTSLSRYFLVTKKENQQIILLPRLNPQNWGWAYKKQHRLGRKRKRSGFRQR
jgi:hypothetical protein